ncbi:MAG: DUF4290 domain-containing protein [Paraprevotella sp.]|nr:DUF4290 domain-containing protein [Paraprevotella sp.]
MQYNTQRKRLPMPEYGRGIQNMVEYALTIQDREERQRCANTIVAIMGNMFPHLRDVPDFKHKLWDHLAVMSDYKLDIDYPYEVKPSSETEVRPRPMDYPMKRIRYRHYGYLLETLLKKMKEMPEGEERDMLSRLVANQMKRSLYNWNKDAMEDEKVAADMAEYTGGVVKLDVERRPLASMTTRQAPPQNTPGRGGRRGNSKKRA